MNDNIPFSNLLSICKIFNCYMRDKDKRSDWYLVTSLVSVLMCNMKEVETDTLMV